MYEKSDEEFKILDSSSTVHQPYRTVLEVAGGGDLLYPIHDEASKLFVHSVVTLKGQFAYFITIFIHS